MWHILYRNTCRITSHNCSTSHLSVHRHLLLLTDSSFYSFTLFSVYQLLGLQIRLNCLCLPTHLTVHQLIFLLTHTVYCSPTHLTVHQLIFLFTHPRRLLFTNPSYLHQLIFLFTHSVYCSPTHLTFTNSFSC